MRIKLTCFVGTLLASFSLASGQTAQRLVVLEANSPLARTNPIFAFVETSVTNSLTTKLSQQGVAVVDRASIDKIIKEQNFQNSDRSDPDTAARIGKLLGAEHIVLVELDAASYTTHDEAESSTKTRTTGTIILKATAKLVDSQTALILAAPDSSYTDSVLVAEKQRSNGVQLPYGIKVPPKNTQIGGDPQVIQTQEWTKAGDAVTLELATKLATTIASAPKPKAAPSVVAGIAGGKVYLESGSKDGIAVGQKFQVVREVSTGLTNKAGKPIMDKQAVCVLTISSVDEESAKGSCQGGLPQKNDVADPVQ
jgi:hypothetical protein